MQLLHIGEVARRSGVSAATVRHYERKGLLRPAVRTASGYREFPPDTLERMHMIQCALAVGFTIEELSRILRKRDAGEAPCREVQSLAQQKLAELTRARTNSTGSAACSNPLCGNGKQPWPKHRAARGRGCFNRFRDVPHGSPK
jgi:DNA-binding transcriptional MerR regulator